MFPATFISGSCDLRCISTSGVLRGFWLSFKGNFADAYILVMAWMGYARARLKTLSSLLNSQLVYMQITPAMVHISKC